MSYPVTNEEMVTAFSDDNILAFDSSVLPNSITNPAARHTLSNVGLPEGMSQSLVFDPTPDDLGRFQTLGEMDDTCAPNVSSLYYLGMWGYSYIALDGVRGDVFIVEDERHVTRLATDLYKFATMLLMTKRDMNENVKYISDDGLTEMKNRLISLFFSMDPNAARDSAEVWRDIIDELVND
jgi:SUKH-4 immunity protein